MADLPENAGVDFRPEDHIYTFSRVAFLLETAEGDKFYYPVASISMQLLMNQIPTAIVVIAPESFKNEEAIDPRDDDFFFVAQPEPLEPTYVAFVHEYRNLQQMILTEGSKASLFVVMERSDGNETQEIAIESWIPREVTVNSTAQAGSFLLSVTITHPAYLASSATGWLPNAASTLDPPETFELPSNTLGSNIPGLFISANKIFIEKGKESVAGLQPTSDGSTPTIPGSTIECTTSLADLSEIVFNRLNSALDSFLQYIDWNSLGGNNLPFDGQMVDSNSPQDSYFGRMLWNTAGRQDSPWMTFVSVAGDYDLVISGAPSDDKLIVTPFVPWGKWSMRLFDSEIYSNQMPGLGRRDVSGVLAGYNNGAENDNDISHYTTLDSGETVYTPAQLNTYGGYVWPLTEDPILLGPVAYRDLPAWLREYLFDQAGDYGPDSEANPMGRNEANYNTQLSYTDAAGGSGGSTPSAGELVGYETLVNRWCRQAFFRLYKSDDAISVSTRLLISSPSANTPGNYVRPGMVIKVSSVTYPVGQIPSPGLAEETPVMYFYVTSVTHEISPRTKSASTTLVGTYVRFAEAIEQAGISLEQIENGIENPIYESLGEYTTVTGAAAAASGREAGDVTITA